MRSLCPRRGRAAALLAALTVPLVPAMAQPAPPPAATAVNDPSSRLSAALRALAANSHDLNAAIAAGRASLEMGDLQAAAGFFGRAEETYPSSPLPKIGMGGALAMSGDTTGAMAYFSQASRLGASQAQMGVDRGLAYDLMGQQALAQADYRAALLGADGDEARRRLALSLAISRDIRGAAAMLEPLLRRGDQGAVRTNAFVLALAGDREGARRTIDAAMPGTGAQFEPFFRFLPSLNNQEKAAAVHLGEFPRDAAQRYAQAQPVAPSPVVSIANGPSQALRVPPNPAFSVQATPSAKKAKPVRVVEAPRQARRMAETPNTYLAMIRPSLDPSRYASTRRIVPKKPVPTTTTATAAASLPAPAFSAPVVATSPPPPPPEPIVPVIETVPVPSAGEPLAPLPEAAATGTREPLVAADGSGADIPPPVATAGREAKPPAGGKHRDTPTTKAKAKPDSGELGATGTYWVQLAGGPREDAMATEYKRIRKRQPTLFAAHPGFVTQGKDYFRLLVGPFDDAAEARAFVTKLDKAGIDSFTWTRSPPRIRIEKLTS